MHRQDDNSGSQQTTPPSSKLSPKSAMIAKAMQGYRRIYPAYGETVTPDLVKLYFRLLDDLDEEILSRALTQAAKECTQFPTPAHIHKIAERLSVGNLDIEAEQALAKLDQLVARWGVDRTPDYVGKSAKHPDGFRRCPEIGGAIGRALASVGGWRAYAAREERDAPFMRKDIIASYKRLRGAENEGWSLIEGGGPAELAGEIAEAAVGRSM